jgi:uncharacterized protein
MNRSLLVNPASARYLPFAIFMAFIGFDEVIRFLEGKGMIALPETALYYLYPVKVILVAMVLFGFRNYYHELTWRSLARVPVTLAACGTGVLVFVLWIQMDWTLSVSGAPRGFDPNLITGWGLQIVMYSFRIFGAVLVVPVMEELFWRSFFIRYFEDSNFENVPIGNFSWASFLITVVLFGLEHHYFFAGMMAGIAYNLILYRTRDLAQCILAHAVTNLALAIYVITTGQWRFW